MNGVEYLKYLFEECDHSQERSDRRRLADYKECVYRVESVVSLIRSCVFRMRENEREESKGERKKGRKGNGRKTKKRR